MVRSLELVSVPEIRELIGVSRQRVHQILHSDPTFPAPVAELGIGRVWLRQEVLEWARRTGRLTR